MTSERDYAIDRMRIAARFLRLPGPSSTEMIWDGAECDGECLAQEIEVAISGLAALPQTPPTGDAKDPVEQHLTDRNRRDTLRRAGIEAAPPTGDAMERRERYARIIDPWAFQWIDKGEDKTTKAWQPFADAAFDKADAILALLASDALAPPAGDIGAIVAAALPIVAEIVFFEPSAGEDDDEEVPVRLYDLRRLRDALTPPISSAALPCPACGSTTCNDRYCMAGVPIAPPAGDVEGDPMESAPHDLLQALWDAEQFRAVLAQVSDELGGPSGGDFTGLRDGDYVRLDVRVGLIKQVIAALAHPRLGSEDQGSLRQDAFAPGGEVERIAPSIEDMEASR